MRRPLSLRSLWAKHAGGEGFTLAALVLTVTLICGLPLLLLFRQGLWADDGFSLALVAEVLASRSVLLALWHSMESAFLAAFLSTLVGLALALVIALTDVRAKGPLVFFILLPMMIPPHVTAISWIQALGPASPVLKWLALAPEPGSPHPLYSREGLVALLTLQHAPLVFLVLRSNLRGFPRELSDAARVSGAGALRMLRRVIIPLLAPAMLSGFALAFVAALGNFGINALIGIPARYTTLPVLIWRRLSSFGPDVLPNVAALSILLALLTFAVLAVQLILQRRMRLSLVGVPQPALAFRLGKARPLYELGLWGFVAATLLLPLSALMATALVPTYGVPLGLETLTFENFIEVIARQSVTARAFVNSTLTAGVAALVIGALAIGLGYYLVGDRSARRRVAGVAATQAEIAYALPGLVISIAFILAFIRPLPIVGVSLYGTSWLILIAYVCAFFAIGLKPVVAAYSQLDPGLDDAARVAGASFGRRMRRIFAPLVGPAAASGAILVFLTAYNEVTVSALLWSTGSETIGTVIFNYEDGGYTTLAAAMSAITVLATVVLMAGLNLLAPRLPPGIIPWKD